MDDTEQTELNIGLSDEEKNDLEALIRSFKEKQTVLHEGEHLPDVQQNISSTEELLAEHAEMLMEFDSKMKSLYEIMRLSHEKSEIMNKRISEIMESLKGREDL